MDSGAQAFWLSSRFQVICPKVGGPHPLSLQTLKEGWQLGTLVPKSAGHQGPGWTGTRPCTGEGREEPSSGLDPPCMALPPPMGVSNCGSHPLLEEHPSTPSPPPQGQMPQTDE